jgi:hypothetical protein
MQEFDRLLLIHPIDGWDQSRSERLRQAMAAQRP